MNKQEFIKFLKENKFDNDIKENNNNLTIGGSLDLRGTGITSLPDNLTIGRWLDLENTGITSLPDNLTIGYSLYLENTGITSLPDNLTIGYSLYLENTGITSLPDNLTIGGSLYLAGTAITSKETEKVHKLQEGFCKEKNYIYYDGILWGNVKSVKKKENITIYKTPLGFCVVENKLSAHGKTLKGAMNDLIFKKLQNTNMKKIIQEIKETGKVTKAQYRAITGACQFGVNQFAEQHKIKDSCSLKKLRSILVNEYGASKFWNLVDN